MIKISFTAEVGIIEIEERTLIHENELCEIIPAEIITFLHGGMASSYAGKRHTCKDVTAYLGGEQLDCYDRAGDDSELFGCNSALNEIIEQSIHRRVFIHDSKLNETRFYRAAQKTFEQNRKWGPRYITAMESDLTSYELLDGLYSPSSQTVKFYEHCYFSLQGRWKSSQYEYLAREEELFDG